MGFGSPTPNGNRTGNTYDVQDRLTTWNGYTFEWTNNGEFADDYYWSTYYRASIDVLGNLRAFWDDYGWGYNHVNISSTYTIDGLDRRAARSSFGNMVEGFACDRRGRVVAWLDATGALAAQFVYVTKSHSPDLMVDKNGKAYRLVSDELGSIRQVVEIATNLGDVQRVKQRIDYDPWGAPSYVSGYGFQPLAFVGAPYEPTTGTFRFGTRDYDPYRGRWLSKDRRRFSGGLNLYAYCENDPVNRIDPRGLASRPPCDDLPLIPVPFPPALLPFVRFPAPDPFPGWDPFGPGDPDPVGGNDGGLPPGGTGGGGGSGAGGGGGGGDDHSAPTPLYCIDPCDTSGGQPSCYVCCDYVSHNPRQCKTSCCGIYR